MKCFFMVSGTDWYWTPLFQNGCRVQKWWRQAICLGNSISLISCIRVWYGCNDTSPSIFAYLLGIQLLQPFIVLSRIWLVLQWKCKGLVGMLLFLFLGIVRFAEDNWNTTNDREGLLFPDEHTCRPISWVAPWVLKIIAIEGATPLKDPVGHGKRGACRCATLVSLAKACDFFRSRSGISQEDGLNLFPYIRWDDDWLSGIP